MSAISVSDSEIIDAVKEAAQSYWAGANTAMETEIDSVLIEKRLPNGDIEVHVNWSNKSAPDVPQDEMIYTVTCASESEMSIFGPRW